MSKSEMIERIRAKAAAYAALSPEERAAVDRKNEQAVANYLAAAEAVYARNKGG